MDSARITKPSTGSILISEPHLNDMYFSKSVILLADHSEEGSFGLILNKPMKARFNEVVQGFPDFDVPVYLGGPVQTDALFFMHTLGDAVEGSSMIQEGLYWGGNLEQIQAMIESGTLRPHQIRFFAGYSGWSPKQLDEELERHSWVVCNASARKLIESEPGEMWKQFLSCLGDDYAIWANYPEDPNLN